MWCPQQDSNLRHRLRRAVLYPLSYGGSDRPIRPDAANNANLLNKLTPFGAPAGG